MSLVFPPGKGDPISISSLISPQFAFGVRKEDLGNMGIGSEKGRER
jgi:hypothetical protein